MDGSVGHDLWMSKRLQMEDQSKVPQKCWCRAMEPKQRIRAKTIKNHLPLTGDDQPSLSTSASWPIPNIRNRFKIEILFRRGWSIKGKVERRGAPVNPTPHRWNEKCANICQSQSLALPCAKMWAPKSTDTRLHWSLEATNAPTRRVPMNRSNHPRSCLSCSSQPGGPWCINVSLDAGSLFDVKQKMAGNRSA